MANTLSGSAVNTHILVTFFPFQLPITSNFIPISDPF